MQVLCGSRPHRTASRVKIPIELRQANEMPKEKRIFPIGISVAVALILAAIVAVGVLRVGAAPEITFRPGLPVIGKRTPVRIDVAEPRRGLSYVKIEFLQQDRSHTLAEKSYVPLSEMRFWGNRTQSDSFNLEIGRDTLPALRNGNATLRVTASRTPTWLRHPQAVVREFGIPVRLTPPSLQLTSIQTYVAQGGCEAVVYRVGETAVRDGVRSGAWFFPGFPLPGGGKQDRFALFAVPYDRSEPDARLLAVDAAGNTAEVEFIDQFFAKPIRRENLSVSDKLLAKVVPEIMSETPELADRGSALDNYLAINGDLRRSNAEELKSLARNSARQFLWTEPFLMMPNAQVMSAFADRRTYMYAGKEVDHQDHLGFDLAVTSHAPVPAANSGVVVMAKYFGIYGNAVVIDHGYGLMTLYGHLSSIAVKNGQKIARGDILGNTGQTGLALGDHLHFTTLLQGLPVTPVEWWDAHWIKDRVAKKLGPALKFQERASLSDKSGS
jgi:murein DD-endopeptidase MepM/ murein hydrolase activator NlpD